MSNIVNGVEELVRGIIPPEMYEKNRKLLDKYHADLEGNVRYFLEEHMDVKGARDIDLDMETLNQRMELLDVHIIHVTVKNQPELNGVWIMKGNKPIVAFTDPRLKNGKVELKKIMLDKSVYNVTSIQD
jgi:hypothetical protein